MEENGKAHELFFELSEQLRRQEKNIQKDRNLKMRERSPLDSPGIFLKLIGKASSVSDTSTS